MKNIFNIKKNYFYYFIFFYLILGIYLSLNVGITHDEYHSFKLWELNKEKFLNVFFNQDFNVSLLESPDGFYGIGFHIFSFPIEYFTNLAFSQYNISEYGKLLIIKHPSVFILFIISGFYFKKIIFIITKSKNFSYFSTILYLTYPYLLGHSFFNIKDIPFLSVWLVCTYYIIIILQFFIKEKKINIKDLTILSFLTAYLLSIRISGVLIFIEYFIFLILLINIYKLNTTKLIKIFYKNFILFFLIFLSSLYILSPSYWDNPARVFNAIQYMSQHVQTACTITFGECMKAQNLPSSYIPIWLFFKLPIIILFGLVIFPIVEKKIFLRKDNTFIIGSLLISTLMIILLLIFLNVNLYDELRQILFLIPIIFIVSLCSIYFFSEKYSLHIIIFFIVFFILQNIKIYPYNYIWLNNFSTITKINNVFELDYWGVSSKKIAKFLNKQNLNSNNCIIANRTDGIKSFIKNKNNCFLPIQSLHKKNARPFYIALIERGVGKGVPNNCDNIYVEKINMNFSKEDLILAKVYKCN